MTPASPIPLAPDALAKLRAFERHLRAVNQRFNLVSRGEESDLWEHHILHCLVFAVRPVAGGCCVVDWGTGGGLPAIPLSIVWPDVRVIAVDSNAKKTRAVSLFARKLGLENCVAVHSRAEDLEADQFGAVQFGADRAGADQRGDGCGTLWSVSRATAPLSTLWSWHDRARSLAAAGGRGALGSTAWEPGLLCLKGGDLREELASFESQYPWANVHVYDVRDYIDGPWFATKKLLHVSDVYGSQS